MIARRPSTTCEVCHDAAAAVVVADLDLTERAVCPSCWTRLGKSMDLTVVRFPAPFGARSQA